MEKNKTWSFSLLNDLYFPQLYLLKPGSVKERVRNSTFLVLQILQQLSFHSDFCLSCNNHSNPGWHISSRVLLFCKTDSLDIKNCWLCLAQHLCAAARGKCITSCDIYRSRPMNGTFGCSLKTFLSSFAFQYQKQGKDVEKVKQRLAEIANYVDKVNLMNEEFILAQHRSFW